MRHELNRIGAAAGDAWRRTRPVRQAVAAQAGRTRANPLVWSTIYVVVFCALAILFLDRPLALWLKANAGSELIGFFKVVTRLGEAQFYLIPSGILALSFLVIGLRARMDVTRQRWLRMAVAPGFLFLSIAVSGLISNLLKFSIGRYRPRYLFESELYGFQPFNTEWGMNSFPSGHSQAGFAAMVALMMIFPRYDAFWILIAILVAMSRVVTTVHYLSDAVAGSYLAVAVAILLARYFRAKGWDPRVRLPHDHRLV